MRLTWKAVLFAAAVAGLLALIAAWWVHKRDAARLARTVTEIRAQAEQGQSRSEFRLGDLYFRGRGLPQDYAKAVYWTRKAADQSYARAQAGLGYMYASGVGLPKDYAEALHWYRTAADQGDPGAEHALGYMYLHGEGVPRDYNEAFRWIEKAADQGDASAEASLAYMYAHGQGVPEDHAAASQWYEKAAKQGDEYAQRTIGLRGSGLSRRGVFAIFAILLACVWLVGTSSHIWQDSSTQSTLKLSAVLGLTYVLLSLYEAFGVLPSLTALHGITFTRNLAIGLSLALAIVGRRTAAIIAAGSATLLIAVDAVLIHHYGFNDLAACAQPASAINGLLLGLLLAPVFWLIRRKMQQVQEAL